jgi:hypothetical protein
MTIEEIKSKVKAAIETFYARDLVLITEGASEWAVAHRIAVYLEHQFEGWNVDCEYNRQGAGGNVKQDNVGEIRRPDITVHHRTLKNQVHNLLVVEVKKEESDGDISRVCEYTSDPEGDRPYKYQYGITLTIEREFKTRYFSEGAELQ